MDEFITAKSCSNALLAEIALTALSSLVRIEKNWFRTNADARTQTNAQGRGCLLRKLGQICQARHQTRTGCSLCVSGIARKLRPPTRLETRSGIWNQT